MGVTFFFCDTCSIIVAWTWTTVSVRCACIDTHLDFYLSPNVGHHVAAWTPTWNIFRNKIKLYLLFCFCHLISGWLLSGSYSGIGIHANTGTSHLLTQIQKNIHRSVLEMVAQDLCPLCSESGWPLLYSKPVIFLPAGLHLSQCLSPYFCHPNRWW